MKTVVLHVDILMFSLNLMRIIAKESLVALSKELNIKLGDMILVKVVKDGSFLIFFVLEKNRKGK